MEYSRIEANRAISLAIAPSTRRSYAAACEEFFNFCNNEGLGKPCPMMVHHWQHFGVYVHHKGLSSRTIQGKMSALAFYTKAQGCPDPASDFWIRKMIEGWNKERGHQEDRRTPMPPKILAELSQVWSAVCSDQYEFYYLGL